MAEHFARSRPGIYTAVAAVAAVALAGIGAGVAIRGTPRASAASRFHPASTTTLPPAPMALTLATPTAGATSVDGSQPVVFTASAALGAATADPTVSPPVDGTWTVAGDELRFTPSVALLPATTYTFTVSAGTRSAGGSAVVGTTSTYRFSTAAGSTLRLQELLAQLGYLPFNWTQTPGTPTVAPGAAVYQPPSGSFTWTWPAPSALSSQWTAGQPNVLTQGAVMAFESDHHLATDGIAGPEVWSALLAAAAEPSANLNPHGYTYALQDQGADPQTLTVWHDGAVISRTPANSGIAQSPTTPGTYPVYERLATQVMRGQNPDGSSYADPVAWVAYFDRGQAIHYIGRASYGSYQSLGCVEVSYATGQLIWPYLTIGSLVTVKP